MVSALNLIIKNDIFLVISTYALLFLLSASLVVRRLHDLNKSGWKGLLLLIPFVGMIFIIELVFDKGTEDSNKYGDKPKGFRILEIFGIEQDTRSLVSSKQKFPIPRKFFFLPKLYLPSLITVLIIILILLFQLAFFSEVERKENLSWFLEHLKPIDTESLNRTITFARLNEARDSTYKKAVSDYEESKKAYELQKTECEQKRASIFEEKPCVTPLYQLLQPKEPDIYDYNRQGEKCEVVELFGLKVFVTYSSQAKSPGNDWFIKDVGSSSRYRGNYNGNKFLRDYDSKLAGYCNNSDPYYVRK